MGIVRRTCKELRPPTSKRDYQMLSFVPELGIRAWELSQELEIGGTWQHSRPRIPRDSIISAPCRH
jgi:hypothetical protein